MSEKPDLTQCMKSYDKLFSETHRKSHRFLPAKSIEYKWRGNFLRCCHLRMIHICFIYIYNLCWNSTLQIIFLRCRLVNSLRNSRRLYYSVTLHSRNGWKRALDGLWFSRKLSLANPKLRRMPLLSCFLTENFDAYVLILEIRQKKMRDQLNVLRLENKRIDETFWRLT